MDVKVVSSSLVKPDSSSAANPARIWTSNLDLVIANIYVKTVYFFRNDGSHGFFSADVLRKALAQALSVYYPMAGRLSMDGNGRLEILCNGHGALLVEATVDRDMADLGEFAPNPSLLKLVPELDTSQDFRSWPLVVLQLTAFRCGGVCLGVGIEHHVADGLSAISFLNSWSDCARGNAIVETPIFDRTCLKARSPPAPLFPHEEYKSLPQARKRKKSPTDSDEEAALRGADEEAVVRLYTFSPDFLRRLQAAAAQDKLGIFSSYELLASHIWRCVCEARGLPSQQTTKLLVAVDGRTRLRPPLPKSYFGNVIFTCCPTSTAGEVTECPLPVTATKIRESLNKMQDTYLRSAIDFLETQQPHLSKFVKGSHTFAAPNLGFTSWAKLPMYECDFGWGRPIHVGPANIPFEGLAYLLASSAGDGSLRLCISLQARHMPRFSELVLADLAPCARVDRHAGRLLRVPASDVDEDGEREVHVDRTRLPAGSADVEKSLPTFVACVQ